MNKKNSKSQLNELLKRIGLNATETQIYIELAHSSGVDVNSLAEELKIPKSTIYDNLERLEEKGLVELIPKSKIKKYRVTDTSNLLAMVQKKEDALASKLNDIKDIKKYAQDAVKIFAELSTERQDEVFAVHEEVQSRNWSSVKDIVSRNDLEKLVWILGADFLEFILLELQKSYTDSEEAPIHLLRLFKHLGRFDELKDLYNELSENIDAQIIFLEYLNIIGETAPKDFLENLLREAFTQKSSKLTQQNFIPAYCEYLWLHEGVNPAIDYLTKNINRHKDSAVYQGKMKFLYGEFNRHKGEYRKAKKLYDESLELLDGTYQMRFIALNYKSISVCNRNKDDWILALENVTKAVNLSKQFEDKSLIARTVLSVGSLYEIQGNSRKALENHKEAYQLGKEMDSLRDEFFAGQNIAITLLQLGQYEESLEFFKKILKTAHKLDRGYYFDMWIGFLTTKLTKDFEQGIEMIKDAKAEAIKRNEQKRIDIADSLIGAALYTADKSKREGEKLLQELKASTSSKVIKEGIDELLSGLEFHVTKLCS